MIDCICLLSILGIASLHVQEDAVDSMISAYQSIVIEHGYLTDPTREHEFNQLALEEFLGILGAPDKELARLKHRVEVFRPD